MLCEPLKAVNGVLLLENGCLELRVRACHPDRRSYDNISCGLNDCYMGHNSASHSTLTFHNYL